MRIPEHVGPKSPLASRVLCYCGHSSRCKSTCRDTSSGFWPIAHAGSKPLFDGGVDPNDASIVALEYQDGRTRISWHRVHIDEVETRIAERRF